MDFVAKLQQHDTPSALQAALDSLNEPPQKTYRFTARLDPTKETILSFADMIAKETGNIIPMDISVTEEAMTDPFTNKLPIGNLGPGERSALIPGRRKRRRNEHDDYDVQDPFIDNSENLYEELGFAKPTTEKEFFVFDGRFTLENDKKQRKSKKVKHEEKPKKKALSLADTLKKKKKKKKLKMKEQGSSSKSSAMGTIVTGMSSTSSSKKQLKQKRPSILTEEEKAARLAEKKARNEPIRPVTSSVQTRLDALKQAASRESFANKSKFPDELRPLIIEAALEATRCGQLDDNYFNILPTLLPYNRFTLRKLTKRMIFPYRMEEFQSIKRTEMTKLKQQVEEAMKVMVTEYEAEKAKYEREKADEEKDLLKDGGISGEPSAMQASQSQSMESDADKAPEIFTEVMMEIDIKSTSKPTNDLDNVKVGTEPKITVESPSEESRIKAEDDGLSNLGTSPPPQSHTGTRMTNGVPVKKFKWTEELRVTLYNLIQAEMEMTALRNEKVDLERTGEKLSEQTQRKMVYQEIIDFWPEGWVTTYLISREYSMHKRKMDKREEKLKVSGMSRVKLSGIPVPPSSSTLTTGGASMTTITTAVTTTRSGTTTPITAKTPPTLNQNHVQTPSSASAPVSVTPKISTLHDLLM